MQTATNYSTAFTPDRLVVNIEDAVSRKVTILSGAKHVRGEVLGFIALGAAACVANGAGAAGANTGTGTLTLDATAPVQPNALVGVYTAQCTAAALHSATFEIKDPKGVVLGEMVVAGALGTATFADRLKFVITQTATEFVVGDGFKITIAAGSGKYILSAAAALDGSAVPDCILADDADASAGDVEAICYFEGQFNYGAMTVGTGHSLATIQETLRGKGIYLLTAQPTYAS